MRIVFQLLCLIFFVNLDAQHYNFRTYSFDQGLNTYNIKKVIQDKYGFIWIATQDGLFRYDGVSFDPIKKRVDNKTSIRENFIFDIAFGQDEDLYVSSFNGGIDIVNIRTLEVNYLLPRTEKELPNLWITKIFIDQHENIWLGGKGYISVYSKKTASLYQVPLAGKIHQDFNISFIKPLDSSFIAIGIDNYGILIFDLRTKKLVNTITNLNGENIDQKIFATDLVKGVNSFFISAGPVVYEGNFTNNKWKLSREIGLKEQSNLVTSMIADHQDLLWIGTNSGLYLFDLHNGRYVEPDNTRLLSQNNFIFHLYIDKDNSLWVSSLKNLQRIDLQNSYFKGFTESKDGKIRMNHIYGMVYKSPTELFACGTDGLYLCNTETKNIRRIKGSESVGIVHNAFRVNEDLWIVSSDYGMYAMVPSKDILSRELLLKAFPEWSGFANNYFNGTVTVGSKVYWPSEEQEGLVVWNQQSRTILQYTSGTNASNGIPENHLHSLKMDRDGFMWLLGDNSVAKFDTGKDSVVEVLTYKKNGSGFNSGVFFDMYDDGRTLWFATYGGGLNGYNKLTKSWTYITEADGLCNNSVYGILPARDSIFWVSTNNGISRINFGDKNCINYYIKDGLHDNSFDESGALKVANKLYFAGVNGFTQIDLEKYFNAGTSFPVYIKKVEYLKGNSKVVMNDLHWDELILPPGTSAVSISLSALSFSNEPAFSYRINGYQSSFLPAVENNKIELNALTHGTYDIDIRYLNEKGKFTDGTLGIKIVISPFWYQTLWFRLFVILASAFFIFYTIRLIYVARLRKQKSILEKQIAVQIERQRISSEMHDDIGAGLSGVRLLTEITRNKIKGQGATDEIDKIYASVGDISAKMKEVIWSLNTENDSLSSLVSYLQTQSRVMMENYPGAFEITIPEKIPDIKINGDARRHIHLLVKEALHNTIKHSGATLVRLTINCNGMLQIIIADNGKGMSVDAADQGGNGMKNMSRRVRQLNGIFLAENNNGLKLTFEIPLNKL